MTQTMTPPALPAVGGGMLFTTLDLQALDERRRPSPAFVALLTAALTNKSTDLDVLYDYTHDQQIGKTGQYWKGRKPASGQLTDVLPQLVQDDQIGPAMAREVDSQFAKDPEWDAMRGGKKIAPEDELVQAMTTWHTDANLTAAVKDAARNRWWAGQMVGRVYIPDDYAEDLKRRPPITLAAALEFVHVEAVDPRQGGPLVNAHGRTLGYWNRYAVGDGAQKATHIELYTPKTFVRLKQTAGGVAQVIPDSEADSPFQDAEGRRRPEFLMWHSDRDGGSAVTRSVRDFQDRLNVVSTYHGRNDEQTGYRQFIVSNAEDPTTPEGKPAAYQMGPGVVVSLRGLTVDALTYGENDQPKRLTPSWEVVDPLNPEEFHIPSSAKWEKGILGKLDQLWTLNPESQVSGESKRQSRKPFDKRVTFGAQDSGAFIAWALRAALMLAAQLLRQQARYQDVTFIPKMFLDIDAVNLEELRVKLTMWQAGALQLVTLLEATPGVSDAAAEAEALAQGGGSPEEQARLEALKRLTGGTGGA